MRCKNCGWDNPNGSVKCEKCGTPLESGSSYANPTIGQSATGMGSANPLNKTVCEGAAFGGQSAPSTSNATSANCCPKCGYPLRPGNTSCPNCGYAVQAASPKAEPEVPKQNEFHPVGGTVNPWINVAPVGKCVLTPVAQVGESETPAPQSFKGDTHNLNRDNLDPDNKTITSQVQATLTFTEGTWYIEDKSAQKTTFVHVADKVALHEGDVILMGNRQFIFHKE